MDWRTNDLYRYSDEGMVGGVCLGLARYLDIDVALVRAIFVGLLVFSGASLMIYLALWVLVPKHELVAPPCAVDGIADDEDDGEVVSGLSQNPVVVGDS